MMRERRKVAQAGWQAQRSRQSRGGEATTQARVPTELDMGVVACGHNATQYPFSVDLFSRKDHEFYRSRWIPDAIATIQIHILRFRVTYPGFDLCCAVCVARQATLVLLTSSPSFTISELCNPSPDTLI